MSHDAFGFANFGDAMGYYSDVAYDARIGKDEDPAALLAEYQLRFPEHYQYVHQDMVEYHYLRYDVDGFYFKANQVKWYDGYVDVEAIEHFFTEFLAGEDRKLPVRFMRTGQDENDIVHDDWNDYVEDESSPTVREWEDTEVVGDDPAERLTYKNATVDFESFEMTTPINQRGEK